MAKAVAGTFLLKKGKVNNINETTSRSKEVDDSAFHQAMIKMMFRRKEESNYSSIKKSESKNWWREELLALSVSLSKERETESLDSCSSVGSLGVLSVFALS